MEEATDTVRMFGEQGGLVGLMIAAFFLLFGLILYGFRWYIMSDRDFREKQEARINAQYEKRIDVEKQWRDSLDRNSNAIYALAVSISKRPCMEGEHLLPDGRGIEERRRDE